jgi:hypothetical protein
MSYYDVSLTLVTVFLVLDLLFSLALTRRVRELQIAVQSTSSSSLLVPELGARISSFSSIDLDGEPITDADFSIGQTIAAFFSAGCEACASAKEKIVESPPTDSLFLFYDTRDQPLTADNAMINGLRDIARVVPLNRDSEVRAAFGVKMWPTFIRIEDGVITSAGVRLTDIENADIPSSVS